MSGQVDNQTYSVILMQICIHGINCIKQEMFCTGGNSNANDFIISYDKSYKCIAWLAT